MLAVIAVAMAVAVLPGFCLAVLADEILADLGISRAGLGIVSALTPAVAALSSVWLGGLADRRGGRWTTVLALAFGAVSLAAIAGATSFALLLGAAIVAGLCQGGATSSTNLVVLEAFKSGRRGVVVGIKQSGEMAAVVLAGVAIPIAAVALGWRWAIAAAVLLPLVAIVATLALLPSRRPPHPGAQHAAAGPTALSRDVWWLMAYATIMGLAGGALSTYFPLYSQQSVGLSTVAAGQVLALAGIAAIPGRILWGHFAERSRTYTGSLGILSILAALAAVLVWSASRLGPELLWIGAIAWGASQFSWGSVAMLGALAYAGPGSAGRATGAVLVGMSVGLTVGPVVFGVAIDATNSYDIGFAGVVSVLVAAAVLTAVWRRRSDRPPTGSGRP